MHDLRTALAAAADPLAAPGMQAYMKSDLPYYGVTAPACRVVFRAALAAHPLPDRPAWLAAVGTLWDQATHREERYAALAVARDRRYLVHRTPDVLPLYRHLVVTGAWWDVVDDVATHLVGPLLLAHPAETGPVVRGWATAEDRWLRRTAVICQVEPRNAPTSTCSLPRSTPTSTTATSSSARRSAGRCGSTPAPTRPGCSTRWPTALTGSVRCPAGRR